MVWHAPTWNLGSAAWPAKSLCRGPEAPKESVRPQQERRAVCMGAISLRLGMRDQPPEVATAMPEPFANFSFWDFAIGKRVTSRISLRAESKRSVSSCEGPVQARVSWSRVPRILGLSTTVPSVRALARKF